MDEKKESITVLMSTYNGEKYLQEQLDSILIQQDVGLNIIIRDDGSTDATVDILRRYEREHNNITIINDGRNLKPCKSFLKLVSSYYEDTYYALSDQDDIWDPDKLICAIRMLKECDFNKPAMYYSNLRLVDENNVFYRNSHSKPKSLENKYLSLIQGGATGCTIVYNKKLAEYANKVKPLDFSMHDTWIFIVCMLFGNVVYDFNPHINYRQHGNNVIGASLSGKNKNYIVRELKRFCNRGLQPRYDNAIELLREFGDDCDPETLEKLLEIVEYKRDFKHRQKLLKDKDFLSDDKYWKLRFKLLTFWGIL